jgi:hypothetical protein
MGSWTQGRRPLRLGQHRGNAANALAATMLIAAFAGTPGEASDVDILLDLLVRKNVVTGQEAAALRAEIARVGSSGGCTVLLRV